MHKTRAASDWSAPRRGLLPGNRWHFQHGPIDLVIGAYGDAPAVHDDVEHAWTRFASVLTELVAELHLLRSPVQQAEHVSGAVARRMVAACLPHRDVFITPMAAVAGAVADEIIEFFRADARIRRAYVNNGGDIALHLREGERYRIGVFGDLGRVQRGERWRLDGDFDLEGAMPSRGVATSGWRGRSFSLGVADSVTVLARNAAAADAAATLIANAVQVDDPVVIRRPACELKDDTDLGERLVTVEVGTLAPGAVETALDAGLAAAHRMLAAGVIHGAVLWLQGRHRACFP
jgi:ApbE superfamily uncharacterized protein (UPF0280 family)